MFPSEAPSGALGIDPSRPKTRTNIGLRYLVVNEARAPGFNQNPTFGAGGKAARPDQRLSCCNLWSSKALYRSGRMKLLRTSFSRTRRRARPDFCLRSLLRMSN